MQKNKKNYEKKILKFPDGKKTERSPSAQGNSDSNNFGTSTVLTILRQITRYLNARLRNRNIGWKVVPAMLLLKVAARERLKEMHEVFEESGDPQLPLHPDLLSEFLDLRRNFVAAVVYQVGSLPLQERKKLGIELEEHLEKIDYLAEQREWDWMSFHEEEYDFFKALAEASPDKTASFLVNRFKQYYLLSSMSLNRQFWDMNQASKIYRTTLSLIIAGDAEAAENEIRSFFENNDTKILKYYDALRSPRNNARSRVSYESVYGGRHLLLSREDYIDLIKTAFAEDRAEEDVTTLAIFDKSVKKTAKIIAREKGTVCGLEVARTVFLEMDATLKVTLEKKDGDSISAGDSVLKVSGNIQGILRAERVALNFISLMSGISTSTAKFVSAAAQYNVDVLDTRKTVPGYRMLAKYAVAIGGGLNHRQNLAVMGMLKDNHIAAAGSIRAAIRKFRKSSPGIPLEVEVDHPDQLYEALQEKPDMILLDNMTNIQLKKSAQMIEKFNEANDTHIVSEASGGFHLNNLDRLADTGVDYVSIGSLTSQVAPLDFGLDI